MSGPPNVEAIKARIMSHMNTDHPDSLEDYLKFYNDITAAPQSAKLIDLNLDSMKIEYRDGSDSIKTSIVKITPPMSSYSESRVKLVAMAEEATGKSFHQPPDLPPLAPVPTMAGPANKSIGYSAPGFAGLITTAGICFGFWALAYEYPLSSGGPLARFLPAIVVELARKYREQLFAMMIGIHIVEAMYAATKCLDNGVPLPLVVLWSVNTFIEGGPAIARINRLIREKLH
jgi:hypothetical protein